MSRDRLKGNNRKSTGAPAERDSGRHSRRKFIAESAKKFTIFASASALATLAAACGYKGGTSPTDPGTGGNNGGNGGGNQGLTIDISTATYSALQTVGGTVTLNAGALSGLPSNGIFIIRSSQSTVTVLSRTCTHQGCQVGAFSGGVATCPCHGSQYNASGMVVRGPAENSLTSYGATLDGNIITIDI